MTQTHLKSKEKVKPEEVCYYSHTFNSFVDEYGNKRAKVLHRKAMIFLQSKCLSYSKKEKCFFCEPLAGYNTRTYTLRYNKTEEIFTCNCQGFKTKEKKGEFPGCSHTLALMYAFKCGYFKKEKQK